MINQPFKYLLAILVVFCSCVKETTQEPNQDSASETFAQLEIPADFDFSTTQNIHLKVTSSNYARNSIINVAFKNDQGDLIDIAEGTSDSKGLYETRITVPTYVKELIITKDAAELQWEKKLAIYSEYAFVDFDTAAVLKSTFIRQEANNQRRGNVCEDYLVAINGQGKSFTIHQENEYSFTEYANIQEKCYAMTYDQENDIMYYDVKGALYRRSLGGSTPTLIKNLSTSSDNINNGYPRMTMKDNVIIVGAGNDIALLDPTTGNAIKNVTLTNIPDDKNKGGDFIFDSIGDLYLACKGGLYRLDPNSDTTVYEAVRISADNFRYYLTGIAIDRFDNIYASSNGSNSKIFKIDKQDGSWAIVHRAGRPVNDLAAFLCSDDDFAGQDSDGDGVNDGFDEYPDDPEVTFDNYYPGENGFGTYAFEDFYPEEGDYDFNDVIIDYRHNFVTNADNKVVRIESKYVAKTVEALYQSGFAIQLPFPADSIASVTGHNITAGKVTLDAKGLETGISAANPVVVVFDNQNAIVRQIGNKEIKKSDDIDMVITFTQPISSETLNFSGFNPFIFVNTRDKEVHLAGYSPTSKFNQAYRNNTDDVGSYRTATNHPWGLSIGHKFHPPKENVDITQAYNNFSLFSTSGGTSKQNWYTDDDGNRNTENIHLDQDDIEE
ncbi:LruC domain-containing protein [Flammeovirga sp. MY04]|uniref:LruC domain-containing protein n=1 Tax=Flammeovirga sp. MY04 TaxID=1191459 RepID=UPI00080625D9|nr:LruC domain-containing protein [Flammeovirga sp. MY04]ANQ50518.1 LruC domain-containing protein [Flammeovirga sp. MY04]